MFYPKGKWNAITDITGVEVGHVTLHDPKKNIHSGVTAIWPRRDVYHFRPRASGHILNGSGEMTGLHQVLEWGLLETPILLTSTLNVGRVYDAVIQYMAEKHPKMGTEEDVLIPIVAECDDSYLSAARERPVGTTEVALALDSAQSGPVLQGSVGAGTGMIAFDYKGGIGTSSRIIRVGSTQHTREFTLGALVNSNVGIRRQLRASHHSTSPTESPRPIEKDRSIIIIIATDAPLRPDQLRRLSVRAGMGLARTGSFASHGSGEIALAFTTSLGETKAQPEDPCREVESLHDSFMNSFFEATVECVEESILNALAAAEPMIGREGREVNSLRYPHR
jgi:D-aminopeptidase